MSKMLDLNPWNMEVFQSSPVQCHMHHERLRESYIEVVRTKDQAMELNRRLLQFYKDMKELHDNGDDLDCLGDSFNDVIGQFEQDMAALAAPVKGD